ncbi:DUF4870 domain-containing protein [Niallia sp. 01092]|uniref:DUF4870 domain-containing protein n=1 Tax=unclassified Niallia TaxID=2837522 RepID=UPI003FD0F605
MEYSKNVSNDEKLFAMLIYVSSLFTVIVGPLIIWLLKRDSEFVDYHGKEYFNFLISYAVYLLISGILMLILIGFVTTPLIGLLILVFTIIAAIKGYEGKEYRIPFVFRIIK